MKKHLSVLILFVLMNFSTIAQDAEKKIELKWPVDIGSTSMPNNGYAYSFKYFIDSIETDFQNFDGFIGNMSSIDTLTIKYRLIGCFGGGFLNWKITKPYGYYLVEENHELSEGSHETDDLTKEWLNTILSLERSIISEHQNNKGYKKACTTSITLTMKLNEETIVFYDQSCDWNGWDEFQDNRKKNDF